MKYLNEAVSLLKEGEVIAVRTDTVYGLLADATNDNAVRKVFGLKQRPLTKPLIVLVNSIEMANEISQITDEKTKIAQDIWINKRKPVTLIFKERNVSKLVTGGGETVAVRIPNNKFCIRLISALGHPVVAPSANISTHPTAISAEMVKADFGDRVPLVINGGICENIPSTIIDMSGENFSVIRGEYP